MRWLKRRLLMWVCNVMHTDPMLFAPRDCVASQVEVRIAGKQLWINTEYGCPFRATAITSLTIETDQQK